MEQRIFKSIKSTILVLITLLFSFIPDSAEAQIINKPELKQIECLMYDINSPRTSIRNRPIIQSYIGIDSIGVMNIILNNRGSKYYSVQLRTEEINAINQVLNGEIKLKKYVLKKKQDKGVFYAGYYYFIRYTKPNNQTEHLSFIRSQLTDELDSVIELIFSLSNPYNNKNLTVIEQLEIKNELLDEVYSAHMKNKQLPPIQLPPPPAPAK